MKELEQPNLQLIPDKVIVAEQQKEYTSIGSMRIKPGLKLWQLNLETDEITEVVRTNVKINVDIKKQKSIQSQAIFNKNCLYTQAINISNAQKKFNKMLLAIINKNKNGNK